MIREPFIYLMIHVWAFDLMLCSGRARNFGSNLWIIRWAKFLGGLQATQTSTRSISKNSEHLGMNIDKTFEHLGMNMGKTSEQKTSEGIFWIVSICIYMLNFKYQTSTCTMYSPSSLSICSRSLLSWKEIYNKKKMFWEFLMQFSLLAVWCTSVKTLVSSLCVKNISSLKNILKNPDEVKYEANFRECHQWLFGSCWWEGKLMGRDISYKCQRKNLLLMPCSHETVRLNKLL